MLVPILVAVLALIFILLAIILIRTAHFARPLEQLEPVGLVELDADAAAAHLAAALRCRTVTTSPDAESDHKEFNKLRHTLEQLYPRVHATLKREIISDHSLLYYWQGRNPELLPILMAAHLDVVPADPATLEQWEHPPFSGDMDGEYIWGRGALDIKSQVMALLESVEKLLKAGFKPERTLYLAFGQDEEVGGVRGAARIASALEERGERLELVLDEGVAIMPGQLPNVDALTALIGISEKGYLSLRLRAYGKGGHSMAPLPTSAIGRLARGLKRLEENPLPTHLDALRSTFQAVGPAAQTSLQIGFANLWLFKRAVRKRMESSPQSNAAIRTTTALTMITGGIKDNILPQTAEAVVNFRLMPQDSVASVIEHVRRVIDDEAVEIEIFEDSAWEASPVSPVDGSAYQSLSRCIREVFPQAVPAPYLVLGATDARYYGRICDQVLRFTPLLVDDGYYSRIHGVNERVHKDAYRLMIQFFLHLLRYWIGPLPESAAEQD